MTYISDDAYVSNSATVLDDAVIGLRACLEDYAVVKDHAMVTSNASVEDRAVVEDYAVVTDKASVIDDAVVGGSSRIRDSVTVCDNAVVRNAVIRGTAIVGQGAEVLQNTHVLSVSGFFSYDSVTLYRTTGGGHRVRVGCQTFLLDDDLEAIASEFGYSLPSGWKELRTFLEARVKSWEEDA